MALKGAQAVVRKLRMAATRVADEVAPAVYQEALIVEGASKLNCPANLGTLRADHVTDRPVIKGRNISVTVAVGRGPSKPYAQAVHEHPSSHSPPSWQGTTVKFSTGGPKFLERAIHAAQPKFAKNVAARISLNRLLR